MPTWSRSLVALAATIACGAAFAAAVSAPETAGREDGRARAVGMIAALEAIRAPGLRAEAAVRVDGLDIEVGPGTLSVSEGVLVPARPVAGRPMEFAFDGEARFRIDAPDDVEAGQLELFTGTTRLDETVRQAVLVVGGDAAHVLAARERTALSRDVEARVRRLYDTWLERPERRNHGAEAAMVRAAVGDPPYARYVALWCRGDALGTFFFQVDPDEHEPVSLGQFVPLDAGPWSRRWLGRHLRSEQRRGRWVGTRVEDLGAWDVWLSSALDHGPEGPRIGDPGLEPERYRMDVRLDPKREHLAATVAVELDVEKSGRTVAAFELHPDLEVRTVRDRLGAELPFARVGDEVLVSLPEPTRAGDRLDLEFVYDGHMLFRAGRREFALRHTSRWYPRCGVLDRARYDVTYRWPRKLDLVASGRTVDGGGGDGERWERRVLDAPAIAVSFELGEFAFERVRVGHVDVTVAFSRSLGRTLPPRARAETVRVVRDTLTFFQSVFGAYPLGELTVVTVPRRSSQAFLGWVTLADSTFAATSGADWVARAPVRARTIAHEMAHQWWGNLVGWRSYRDQWLSEAMADYAALLYLDHRGGGRSRSYLADLAAGWRGSLVERLKDGRTLESVGPLVVGERLNSSKAGDAYQAIVYRKGAVVLAMLARSFDEAQFLGMLRSLAEVARYRTISTESFLRALEHMSGRDLSTFALRYVYGTGIPDVYWDYEVERDADGDWLVRGRAEQISSRGYRHRVVPLGGGRWDVVRDSVEHIDVRGSDLAVPLKVVIEPEDEPEPRRGLFSRWRRPAQPSPEVFEGVVHLRGAEQEFQIRVPRRPTSVALDPRGEILARFEGGDASPKRSLYLRARAVADVGDHGRAETLFRDALAAPHSGESGDDDVSRDRRREARAVDARIRLELARLLADLGRDGEAATMVDAAESDLHVFDRAGLEVAFTAARARLDLRRGDARGALSRLRRIDDLLPRRYTFASRRQYWLYVQLHSSPDLAAEIAGLHAVASRVAGDDDEFRRAEVEATERGCDLSALEAAADAGGELDDDPL